MTRDWDMIRDILLRLEEASAGQGVHLKDFPEDQQSSASYNAALLHEAGFVFGNIMDVISPQGAIPFVLRRLTWQGHELLDAIRPKGVWEEMKATFRDRGVGMAYEVVKTLGVQLATDTVLGGR